MLQEESNSDVARFTTHESNLSCNKSDCCSFEMLLQKAQSSSPFWNKICTCCAFYWPKANLFCSNWSNSYVWRDSRIFLSNQKLVFSLLAAAWFVTSQVWTLVVKRTTSLFNSFFSNVAKQVASFCCPVCRTFRRFVSRFLILRL